MRHRLSHTSRKHSLSLLAMSSQVVLRNPMRERRLVPCFFAFLVSVSWHKGHLPVAVSSIHKRKLQSLFLLFVFTQGRSFLCQCIMLFDRFFFLISDFNLLEAEPRARAPCPGCGLWLLTIHYTSHFTLH